MNTILSFEQITRIRKQTKGSESLIHFNNAGASLPPDIVLDTVIDYLKEEAVNGGYETEAKYQDLIQNVPKKIADFIGAQSSEIALFENASSAWMTAFKGIFFQSGDEIITSEMEYVTNIIGLSDIQSSGINIVVIPNDENGDFDLDALKQAIGTKTKLIMITHISSSGGSVLPIEEIGAIASQHQILYLVDACQSFGQIPLDVEKIKCDMLSATGRKYMRAPRGTGFLYVRNSILDTIKPTLLDFQSAGSVSLDGYTLRADAKRFELYEKNRALTLGLGAAVDYATEIGMEGIWHRIQHLASLLRTNLSKIKMLTLHDKGSRLSGIVTFTIDRFDSAAVKAQLQAQHINLSIGGQQATPIYMDKKKSPILLRASIHYYNTEEEILKFTEALSEIIT